MKRPNMLVQGQGFVQPEELSQQYFAAIIPVISGNEIIADGINKMHSPRRKCFLLAVSL